MSKIKYFIRQSWLLIVSAFCFGLLIAVANAAWSPRIERNKVEKLNRLMSGLLPEASSFKLEAQVEIKSPRGQTTTSSVYAAVSDTNIPVGWVFNCEGPGFQDKIELVVAVDKGFEKFAGYAVLSSNETPGFGDKIKRSYYRNQFKGAPVEELGLVKTGDDKNIDSEIVAISGATVSSQAVVDIINNVVVQIKNKMQERAVEK
jgi:electron transport complex protein RnfG